MSDAPGTGELPYDWSVITCAICADENNSQIGEVYGCIYQRFWSLGGSGKAHSGVHLDEPVLMSESHFGVSNWSSSHYGQILEDVITNWNIEMGKAGRDFSSGFVGAKIPLPVIRPCPHK